MIPIPSVLRRPRLILPLALRHPAIFVLGWREGRGGVGLTYDDDAWSDRSMAYDAGRDLRRWGRA